MLTWPQNARRALTTSRCRLQPFLHWKEHYEEKEEDGDDGRCDAIASLCKKGRLDRAMELLQQEESLLPPAAYLSLLKLCNQRSALHHAKHVGAHMAVHHRPSTITTVNEYLVLTLCRCGDSDSALSLFHSLPVRTVFSWTAIISAYISHGDGVLALQVYAGMLEECVLPNEYAYISLLKACSSIPSLQSGKVLHARAWKHGLHSHVTFASALITMYGKCGAVSDAERTFMETPQHDVVSWTSMILTLVEHERVEKAMILYRQMEKQGVAPNEWTVSACLQGCYILAEPMGTSRLEREALQTGRTLHHDATLKGFERQVFVGNGLLRMYAKCGYISEAENVFCSLSNCDIVSWTAMLSLYLEQSEPERALQAYRQMLQSCMNPDKLALLVALQACCMITTWDGEYSDDQYTTSVLSLEIGWALHADARRKGLVSDVFIGNTLICLFTKCRRFIEAETVFAELDVRDVVSFTVMLPVYTEQGQAKKALQLYQQMQKEGVSPDEQALANVLKACCKYAEEELKKIKEEILVVQVVLELGRALHHDAVERGYAHSLMLGSELVILYGKCGSIPEAEYSFKMLLHPDAMAHSAMLAVYIKEGQKKEAMQLYTQMLTQGISTDDTINGCMLQSCSASRSLKDCRQMHHSILWSASDSVSLELATQLVFAYASCGSTLDAQAVLNSLPASDVVTWNALMSGCIRNGDYSAAFEKHEEMQRTGIDPNEATFLSLLSACCHAGLIQRGVEYFESMSNVYKVTPRIQHFGCMIDLLGRTGDFDRIKELLFTMQVQPDISMWLGLLGACQVYGNVELGNYAYERAVGLQPRQAAAYVLMSNIFANAGKQDQADEVNLSRQKASAWKKPGQSWISINGVIHTFVVKENAISEDGCLACMLQQKHTIWRLEGFIPQTDQQPS